MRITFESGIPGNPHTEKSSDSRVENGSSAGRCNAAYRADISGNGKGTWETAISRRNGRRHSLEELQRDAANMDTQVIQDYRTVMSHTMSDEDYARLDKSGFSMEQLDPATVVTIVDKIKAELARSGQKIEGYTDDLDVDTLAAAVGSRGLAQAITDSFAANDIPLTGDNVERALKAVSFARELERPGDEQYRYMVDNEMDPEIMSFYRAQSSVFPREGAAGRRNGGREAYRAAAGGDGESGRSVSGVAGETGRSVSGVSGETGRSVSGVASEAGRSVSGVAGETGRSVSGVAGEAGRSVIGVAGEAGRSVIGLSAEAGRNTSAPSVATGRSKSGPSGGPGQETVGGALQGPDYFADDVEGYYSRNAGTAGTKLPDDQIEKVLNRAGLPINEDNREKAAWLVDQGLPLTEENLLRYDALTRTAFPVEPEQAVQAAAAAIAEGKDGVYGNLADTENIYRKAAGLADSFAVMTEEQFRDQYGTDLMSARRHLEEIRLRMTAEVNVKLIKSGFSIDTAPMEELIEALRLAEKQVAGQYFPQDGNCVEKYECYTRTCSVMDDIPWLPADILGRFQEADGSLWRFHEEGRALQEEYRRAGESYEALMTAPRPDMGDHIRKAFRNVDDILEDMNLECTQENRRAVRILGYNRMEITSGNIDRVIRADEEVSAVVERMTPAAALRMIRDGVNPLEKSFEELNQYFDSLPEEYEEQAESYSRFLYNLEQNKSVTSEERSAYIGVFRLLHQVEKSDGAAVGTLVNSQAQLNFSNLLSAVRTGKIKHMDRRITEESGFLSQLTGRRNSISSQIEKGFLGTAGEGEYDMTHLSEEEAVTNSRVRQELEVLRQAAETEQECVRMLEQGSIPLNAANLLAAQGLRSRPTEFLSNLTRRVGRRTMEGDRSQDVTDMSEKADLSNSGDGGMESMWSKLDRPEDFREEYRLRNEDALGSVESLTMKAETSIDVRELKLLHRQLTIVGGLGERDEYYIPMKLGEEETLVHLRLEQKDGVRGQVNITVESESQGRMEGRFYLDNGHVSGYLAGNSPESVMKLQKAADIFTENVSEEWAVDSLQITEGNIGRTALPVHTAAADADLYHIAKQFLTALKDEE